jgi:hypothetical protein
MYLSFKNHKTNIIIPKEPTKTKHQLDKKHNTIIYTILYMKTNFNKNGEQIVYSNILPHDL